MACKVIICSQVIIDMTPRENPFASQAKAFQYGNGDKAKFQLQALAAKSHVAFQSLEYNCKLGDSAVSIIGSNRVEFKLEPSWSVFDEITIENKCQVG